MEKLIEILKDIQPEIDYETCTDLINEKKLDSLSLFRLVAEMEDAFDVSIPATEIIPSNFNSLKQMWEMINHLKMKSKQKNQ